jgi:hypothetical protein
MAECGQDCVTVIQHLVGRVIFHAIPPCGSPSDGRKEELPIAFGAIALVNDPAPYGLIKMRTTEFLSFQDVLLVTRFTTEHLPPKAFV